MTPGAVSGSVRCGLSDGGVDDRDQLVVERGPGGIRVSGGVVALAAQDFYELDAGLVETASLADGLEAAVQLGRSGAVPVGQQPPRGVDVAVRDL